jgi:hypothetical protein
MLHVQWLFLGVVYSEMLLPYYGMSLLKIQGCVVSAVVYEILPEDDVYKLKHVLIYM